MSDFRGQTGRVQSPMKRSNRKRRRPEEVVAKLRQADDALTKGTPIAGVARSLGVSEVTLSRWRDDSGEMDRDAVRGLKDLEKETARLRRLVAEQQFWPPDPEISHQGGVLRPVLQLLGARKQ